MHSVFLAFWRSSTPNVDAQTRTVPKKTRNLYTSWVSFGTLCLMIIVTGEAKESKWCTLRIWMRLHSSTARVCHLCRPLFRATSPTRFSFTLANLTSAIICSVRRYHYDSNIIILLWFVCVCMCVSDVCVYGYILYIRVFMLCVTAPRRQRLEKGEREKETKNKVIERESSLYHQVPLVQ